MIVAADHVAVYLVWKLEDFIGANLRQWSFAVSRRQIIPCLVRELVTVEEGIIFPQKAEYERLKCTLAVMNTSEPDTILELPAEAGDAHAVTRVVYCGGRSFETPC